MASLQAMRQEAAARGLYCPEAEKDACGVGFVANIKGKVSHKVIEDALLILRNLDHRGAVGADPLFGDGAGILIQIPDSFYREELSKQGIALPAPGDYGVGMIFLPREPASRQACEQELERMVKKEGQVLLGWRDVPVDTAMQMSPVVRESEPVVRQIFIGRGPDVMVQDALERKLYVIRKSASHRIRSLNLKHGAEYFVPSMSTRTVVYKGLLLADQVGRYYKDLLNPACKSAIAVVHQRFSTNTFPAWALAHPYRYVAHNGEINTVKGNYNWICARENVWKSAVLGDDVKKLVPLIYEGQSDTASLDNAVELLVMAGYSLPQAMMMLVPEAWEKSSTMDPDRQAFYAYHAPMMEAWDGPAALVFTNGAQIGAMLDRNGLRPARYIVTDDDTVVLASEVGVLPIPESRIRRKWRIEPGKMLLIDTVQGRIIGDDEIKNQVALDKPYREWVERLNLRLADLTNTQKEEQESRLGQNAEERPEDTAEECRKTAGQNGASAASPHAPERIPKSYRNADEQTALWEEDEEMQERISEIIQSVKDWGSLSGKMAETILAADRVRIDYRQILNSFKASILSSRRCLTRMKPSRRYGYQQMGQRHSFSTGLLIAIDTSGSISSTALCKFYGIVNHFFQYGIEHMDVIQFDAAVQGEPVSLRKARKEIKACGRGGTNFQPVIDFAAQRQNRYDGLLILTDGHAPIPILPQGFHLRIAWVCESREAFLKHKGWMQSLGKACYMNL